MNRTPNRILLVEDDKSLSDSLSKALRSVGYQVDTQPDGINGIRAAQEHAYDLVITDMKMPGADGLAVLEAIRAHLPKIPIILTTAFSTPENAIKASRLGAYEYLTKPLDVEELIDVIERAITASKRKAPQALAKQTDTDPDPKTLVGSSRAMREVYQAIGRYAESKVTVLIQGETGVGKELVAKALHLYSERKNKPFVAINCAALPENLLESELFGFEKGAFTGADSSRTGCFEQAQGGTLFLDEIGDIPKSTQVRLLRALQERVIRRLGSNQELAIDTRIIAATHRDLPQLIKDGEFREDLYYRLNAAQIRIPPLRERPGDIEELAGHVLHLRGKDLGIRFAGISDEALEALKAYRWPGNARQLENIISKLLIRSKGYVISKELTTRLLHEETSSKAPDTESVTLLVSTLLDEAEAHKNGNAHAFAVQAIERELFSQALQRSDDNLAQAARWLGLSRLTLRRKLQSLELRN